MTDSLRTRIIAALARADQDWCSDNNLHEDMADAVIRELSLQPQRETGEIVNLTGGEPIKWGRTRYVTEWENDD